jgi:hypothetical protein
MYDVSLKAMQMLLTNVLCGTESNKTATCEIWISFPILWLQQINQSSCVCEISLLNRLHVAGSSLESGCFAKLGKKLLVVCRKQRFINMIIISFHWTLSWASWFHSIPSLPLSPRSILMVKVIKRRGQVFITLLLRIREVPGSNICKQTDYPGWSISLFFPVPSGKCRDSTLN